MGVRFEWADDRHIILNFYIESPWTWEEYNQAAAKSAVLLKDLKYPCASAVDTTHMGSIPSGNVIQHLTRMEKGIPDNVFATALIGAPAAIKFFIDILEKLRWNQTRKTLYAENMQQAHEKIYQLYKKLYPEG